MQQRTVILVIVFFSLIVGGMLYFAYLKANEAQDKSYLDDTYRPVPDPVSSE